MVVVVCGVRCGGGSDEGVVGVEWEMVAVGVDDEGGVDGGSGGGCDGSGEGDGDEVIRWWCRLNGGHRWGWGRGGDGSGGVWVVVVGRARGGEWWSR
ncbi:hypothetical protein Tco_0075297, partial [Tanacetum coccineum]